MKKIDKPEALNPLLKLISSMELLDNNPSVMVCRTKLTTRWGVQHNFALLNLTEDMAAVFTQNIKDIVADIAEKVDHVDYASYRILESRDSEKFYYLERSKVAGVWATIDGISVLAKDPRKLGVWGGNHQFTPNFYCVRFVAPETVAYYFRFSPPKQYSKEKRILGLFSSGGTLESLKHELLSFDSYADALCVNGSWYILDPKRFEMMFDLQKLAEEEIEKNIEIIQEVVPLANSSCLTEACKTRKSFAQRLAAIVENKNYESIDPDKVAPLAQEELNQDEWVNGDGELDCAQVPTHMILNILGDRYSRAYLSGRTGFSSSLEEINP